MTTEPSATPNSHESHPYLAEMRRRARRGTWETRLRVTVVHLAWLVVLAAGAAVAVLTALGEDTKGAELAPWLGFTVVVFQGVGRIFDRTSEGSKAVDTMRRGIDRELRLYQAGGGHYANLEDPFARFVTEAEELMAAHDDVMTGYLASLSDH